MPQVVYVKESLGAATRDGFPVHLIKGDVWDATDQFVRDKPELFTSEPTLARPTGPAPVEEVRVEQATRNPGQRRNR